MGFFDLFKRKPSVVRFPAVVRFDDQGIDHATARGTVERVDWAELAEVGIITTSDGPAVDDVFWMLLDRSKQSGCAIPSETPGMDALLPRLQALPGFDNEAVIRAMGSCTDARFVCWRRPTTE